MSTERAPINVLLRGEQSGEQIAVMDNTISAGFPGPPLHHHDFDETFYVLEGELTFQLEDELFTRTATGSKRQADGYKPPCEVGRGEMLRPAWWSFSLPKKS